MIEEIRNSGDKFKDGLMQQQNFGPFVLKVMQELQLSSDDICDLFAATIPAVNSWTAGEAKPQPSMRARVISKLAAMVMQQP
ncbi:MAG: hypothetical protein JWO96_715 [Candidatus Saccharibacteria bacterium]|nr:hypothetical protein [Candidatus Saccharibacteria bacterium]